MVRKPKFLSRRPFLLSFISVCALLLGSKLKHRKLEIFGITKPEKDFLAMGTASLGDRAKAKGLLYGAFPQADSQTFAEDIDFQSQLAKECNILIGGFYWNWDGIRPNASTYDFTKTDYFAEFARANNMLFRGHPLIWYRTTPDWLLKKFNDPNTTSQEIKDILTQHISKVVGRYAGKVHFWDVVNEAIYIKDGHPDGFRDTKISGINDIKCPSWFDFLGPEFIDLAFRTAAKSDPQATLIYNDNYLNYDIPNDVEKRQAVLNLLKSLKAQGTPIDALGIQAHLTATNNDNFNPLKFRQFLREVANLDLKIIISELDVRDRFFKGDINSRDRAVARAYNDFLTIALEEPAVIAVNTWGLSDRYSWTNDKSRPDGTPQRPLPLDSQLNRKLAWHAIAEAFDNAPHR